MAVAYQIDRAPRNAIFSKDLRPQAVASEQS